MVWLVVGALAVARCQCPGSPVPDAGDVLEGGGSAGGESAGGGGGGGGGAMPEEDAGPPLPAVGCEVNPAAPRATPECQPPSGACTRGADCPSGLCLRLGSGATCTQRCGLDAGCSNGWACVER